MSNIPRLIHNNDLAFMLGHNVVPPLSKEEWLYELVGRFIGTQIDVLVCDIHGGADILPQYPTAVEEARLAPLETFNSVGEWRQQRNHQWLIENDPYPEAITMCRDAGMQFWIGMRFNDIHDHRTRSRFRVNHPDCILGHHSGSPAFKKSGNYCKGFNYARPEVRTHVKRIIEDACTRYDLDGFELDFTRHPGIHFPDMDTGRPILTDYLGEIRALLDKIGADRGRRIGFGCRTYHTLERSYDYGLDVAAWVQRKLFDYLNPSILFGSTTESFFKPFVQLARGTNCRVYATTTEHLEQRWCPPGRRTTPLEVVRAGALNAWRDGVDGIYTMNWCIPIFTNHPDLMQALRELGDPATLEFTDKLYTATVSYTDTDLREPTSQLPSAFDVQPNGPGRTIRFSVADDLSRAARLGVFESLTLELVVSEPAGEKIECALNGRQLPAHPQLAYTPPEKGCGGNVKFVFNLDGPEWIRQGPNELRIVVRHRDPALLDKFTVFIVDVIIRYRNLPMRSNAR